MTRAQFCSSCGAPLVANASFCAKCGATVVVSAGPSAAAPSPTPAPAQMMSSGVFVPTRPGIVTLLAVLHFVGAAFWMLMGLGALAGSASTAPGAAVALAMTPVLIGLGLAQLFAVLGLLRLKPYGRTLAMAFAWIGLLGVPFGTVISILILIYFFKPGIKLMFAGRPGDDFTEQELAAIRTDTSHSGAMIAVIVVVCALLLIALIAMVAAIAIPGLMRARTVGNEVTAIAALRAIHSAEVAYAASCAQGGYAIALEDLAKPPLNGGAPFLTADLGEGGIEKSGYIFTVTRDRSPDATDIGSPAATCNGSTDQPASSYFASAEPVSPGASGMRYFAVDAAGTIYQSMNPISNPIMSSTGVSPIR